MHFLAKQETCYFGDIHEELPIAKATVSQHLKELKDAGLIQGEVETPKVKYCITVLFFSLLFVVLRITYIIYDTMEIKVLGTGCANCKALYATVEKVVNELGIQAEIIKEEDLMKIMEYNVMTLPALVINGKVVAKGRINAGEVKELITSNQ